MEKEETKKQIGILQKQAVIIDDKILELARDKFMSIDKFFSVVGTWDCPKSPSGLCCYHHYIDLIHDHCVFCGQPEERK